MYVKFTRDGREVHVRAEAVLSVEADPGGAGTRLNYGGAQCERVDQPVAEVVAALEPRPPLPPYVTRPVTRQLVGQLAVAGPQVGHVVPADGQCWPPREPE